MVITIKTPIKRFFGTILCLTPAFWILYLWFARQGVQARFSGTEVSLLSLGRISALLGLVLFSVTMLLHARIRPLQYILDAPYITKLHHVFGSLSFILILAHPIFLALRIFITNPYMAARFLLPSDENLANLVGLGALFMMGVVMIVTNYLKGQPFMWKWIHRVMILVLAASLIHVLLVSSDLTQSSSLKLSLIGFMSFGFLAFIYQRVIKYKKTRALANGLADGGAK